MRSIVVVLLLLVLVLSATAVGTKKKKQRIVVRREFVPGTAANAPVEFHADTGGIHWLRCRGTGLQWCGWKAPPQLFTKEYTLEGLDKTVFDLMRTTGARCTFQIAPNLAIYTRRLPNGYEYTIEEGYEALPEFDSLRKVAERIIKERDFKSKIR